MKKFGHFKELIFIGLPPAPRVQSLPLILPLKLNLVIKQTFEV